MRFAYCMSYNSSMSWARRLYDEGKDILVYTDDESRSAVGQGLVPICLDKRDWIKWGKSDPNTIFFFDFTENGELADKLRNSGSLVLGGGSFMDRLEKERSWGESLAKEAGILCPPTKSFSNISASLEFLKSNPEQTEGDGGWAWKPEKNIGCDATLVSKDTDDIINHVNHIRSRFGDSIPCILQEKIKGVAISTWRWFNGLSFVGPYAGTIEEKKFLNGDLGPATGCSLNTMWFYDDPKAKIINQLHFDELEPIFKKNNAPPGLYDINAILNKKGAWFLEWTPRLGYDTEMSSQRSISSLSGFMEAVVKGKDITSFFNMNSVYHGVRLSVPPYPTVLKEDKSPAIGIPIRGYDGLWDKFFVVHGASWTEKEGLVSSNSRGEIGTCVTSNPSISKGYEDIYKYLKTLKVQDLQYRTDAAEIVLKDVQEMLKYGYKTTKAMRR